MKRSLYETKLKFLRRELKARDKFNRRALKLQAKEYERRLEDLNHAHALAETDKETYEQKESADIFRRTYNQQRDELTVWQSNITAKVADVQARAATWVIAVGLGVSLLSIIMGLAGIGVTVLLKVLLK